MPIVIEVPESFAPVTLHPGPMTDEEFLAFCEKHSDLAVESNAKGEIELMPPTGIATSDRNSDLNMQLRAWAKRDGHGKALDSNALFILGNGARRSPDASWLSLGRIATVPKAQKDRPWRVCPEFVVELRSHSDRKTRLHAKMLEWIENGAELGWLLDPVTRTVTVYRRGRDPEVIKNAPTIQGEGPVAGFTLDLTDIWAGL